MKYLLFVSDFNETLFLSIEVWKNTQTSNFMKTFLLEPNCSMRTDRQTNTTNLIIDIRNFEKSSKRYHCYVPR